MGCSALKRTSGVVPRKKLGTMLEHEEVLPRFEVAIDAPSSISILDNNVTISTYGRYTYGEKVQGNVTLKVCQKKKAKYSWWWGPTLAEKETETKDLCYNEVVTTDQTGKMQCFLDLGKFNLQSSDYARELTIDIVVEEEGTGVKFSAAKSIKLESQLTKLSFKDTKSYFLPGVPYRGKMSLTSFEGHPIALKKVHIRARYDGEENKETFVTDSNGDVIFELSTEKWGKNSVSLEATTEDTTEPDSSSKESISYGRANLYLKDIYVETKSYLYIRPVKSSAPCHQNVAVTVDYFLEGEQDKGSFQLFYLVSKTFLLKTISHQHVLSAALP
ncbi:PREDICTED: alpha-2-macroglobulin-like protein 1 [Nanorana parkeri]|uniref:alpha-2-macroglobulin-like protein 1 n=1 Tax=Nanorana parkeri TaxID=125878 RepID=UPI0008543F1D|nr:PREDICTED: alpha-2-macroglobulin-like protein 1 [Nanorana parkeri]